MDAYELIRSGSWLGLSAAGRTQLLLQRDGAGHCPIGRIAGNVVVAVAHYLAAIRGLPVTPGTLYLAHFAGSAGAVAILSADEQADAASTMASADASGRTTRENLVRANPFLERLTVADLKTWADRKMRVRPL